jgi:hypothetical protein
MIQIAVISQKKNFKKNKYEFVKLYRFLVGVMIHLEFNSFWIKLLILDFFFSNLMVGIEFVTKYC